MRLKLLSVGLIILSLTACSGMPQEPEIEICTPEYKLDASGVVDYHKSQVFCMSDVNPDDESKQHYYTFDQYMKLKPVMTTAQEYAKKLSWGQKVQQWGSAHCK